MLSSRWRRIAISIVLVGALLPAAAGAFVFAQLRASRHGLPPPAELLSLGPIWVGDFCRNNVAHHRYPPGWCPRDYTLYVIISFGSRSTIYPIMRIPESTPAPRPRSYKGGPLRRQSA